MVLKKSIKQNIVLKNLDINNMVLGDDGLLWQKNELPNVEISNEAIKPSVKNAFVFLESNQEINPKEEKITKNKKVRKKKDQ